MLVDDEPLSLIQLQTLLEHKIGGVEVIGAFIDPIKALEEAHRLQPDVVFLDINMPEMDGLAMGERLQFSIPKAEIVFITGYNQYAVEAFELNALDYIMKPILLERLKKTMRRLQDRLNKGAAIETGHAENGQPLICCFQRLQLQLPGQEPQLIKWRTTKALELFAYLLHHRDKIVRRDAITELLWPDFDTDRAARHLYTTIYNIRQTLKSEELGMVSISSSGVEGGYMLRTGAARIDTELWEDSLSQFQTLDGGNIERYWDVLQMYRGDYLASYDFLWAESKRERLRRLWRYHAQRLGTFYSEQKKIDKAIVLYRLFQKHFPLEEDSFFMLMKLYDLQGKRIAVEEQFRLLTAMMETEWGSPVNAKILEWYASWNHKE